MDVLSQRCAGKGNPSFPNSNNEKRTGPPRCTGMGTGMTDIVCREWYLKDLRGERTNWRL